MVNSIHKMGSTVKSREDKLQEYLDFSVILQPMAEAIDGFISNERFQSVTDPSKVLSLSFWKDEESIKQFRKLEMHLLAEAKGRESILKTIVSKSLKSDGITECLTENRHPLDCKILVISGVQEIYYDL